MPAGQRPQDGFQVLPGHRHLAGVVGDFQVKNVDVSPLDDRDASGIDCLIGHAPMVLSKVWRSLTRRGRLAVSSAGACG